MNHRIGKAALAAIPAACLAIAAYWYWSPFLAMRAMQSAAQAQDAAAFNAHIDYPRVRDSLKAQLSARMTSSTDTSNPLAALGTMMGLAVVDRLVDAIVRPEIAMRGMQTGQFGTAPSDTAPQTGGSRQARPAWSWTRQGTDRLIAFRTGINGQPDDRQAGIVFERSGFATWKVTALRLGSARP